MPVRVDQMSAAAGAGAAARRACRRSRAALAAGLLEETGRWPLLLRLVNKILADQAQAAARHHRGRARSCWAGCALAGHCRWTS